jgi:hypothetical protein
MVLLNWTAGVLFNCSQQANSFYNEHSVGHVTFFWMQTQILRLNPLVILHEFAKEYIVLDSVTVALTDLSTHSTHDISFCMLQDVLDVLFCKILVQVVLNF